MMGFQQMELLAQSSGIELTVGLTDLPESLIRQTTAYGSQETWLEFQYHLFTKMI
jgi:hypothetical protein